MDSTLDEFWKTKLEKEISLSESAREEAEEVKMKLEERLSEAVTRIEEWKHQFLVESQERAQLEQQILQLQSELTALKAKQGLHKIL